MQFFFLHQEFFKVIPQAIISHPRRCQNQEVRSVRELSG